jgi:hypothetical protein
MSAAWDISRRDYAVALYDRKSEQLQPLTDEEAAILLNRDPLIRKEWKKWNAASKNRGRLIILDSQRARRVLRAATDEPDEDNEMKGLA